MMHNALRSTALATLVVSALWAAGPAPVVSTGQTASPARVDTQRAAAEEEWLKTVWSQIDSLVVQQDFKVQKTVVAAGVRGAGADDLLRDQYYFKGGKRYTAKETLEQVLKDLERRMRHRRRGIDRARLEYLTAICADMLGQYDEARRYYERVIEKHGDTPFAARARQRLPHLPAPGKPASPVKSVRPPAAGEGSGNGEKERH